MRISPRGKSWSLTHKGPCHQMFSYTHLTNKTLLLIRRVTYHSFPEILYLNLLRCYKSSSKDFQRLWARSAAENPKRRDWQCTEIQTSPPLRPVLSVTSYRFSVCNIQMPWQVLILTKFQKRPQESPTSYMGLKINTQAVCTTSATPKGWKTSCSIKPFINPSCSSPFSCP